MISAQMTLYAGCVELLLALLAIIVTRAWRVDSVLGHATGRQLTVLAILPGSSMVMVGAVGLLVGWLR